MFYTSNRNNRHPIHHLLTNRVILSIFGGWLFLSLTQTLHFYWYFEQSLWNSIRWSFRDWFVWFIIFAGIFSLCANQPRFTRFSISSLSLVACIAIGSGILQTLIIISMDFIAGTASRPFWQDFAHFYSKRWLQHLFIFVVFWLLMINRFFIHSRDNITPAAGQKSCKNKIQINDGKENLWLPQADIFSIEAAGNYVCFHTSNGQLIARGSLKNIEGELDENLFVRVSRSHIVNINAIVSSTRVTRSKVELVLSNDQIVTIGPTYWRTIKARLDL